MSPIFGSFFNNKTSDENEENNTQSNTENTPNEDMSRPEPPAGNPEQSDYRGRQEGVPGRGGMPGGNSDFRREPHGGRPPEMPGQGGRRSPHGMPPQFNGGGHQEKSGNSGESPDTGYGQSFNNMPEKDGSVPQGQNGFRPDFQNMPQADNMNFEGDRRPPHGGHNSRKGPHGRHENINQDEDTSSTAVTTENTSN